jgi:single stranded DNA-binding protein (ssb)
MAASLNKVFLMGNLTRPPELRYTPSGTAVADLRLAVNRNYTTQSGEKRDEVCFLTVVVWGKQAESCGEYLDKGSPIMVEGRLQTRDWETKDGRSGTWSKSSPSACNSWDGANRGLARRERRKP